VDVSNPIRQPAEMLDVERLKAEILGHEGEVKLGGGHVVYDDKTGKPIEKGVTVVGNPTIGYGRLIDRRKGINDEEAQMLFNNDILSVIRDLDKVLPWWRQMNAVRQRVLANMCFNLGIKKLVMFMNTLRAMREERYHDAADGMLKSLWAEQVGDRARRLSTMMRTGREPV
jgi:lysozyme